MLSTHPRLASLRLQILCLLPLLYSASIKGSPTPTADDENPLYPSTESLGLPKTKPPAPFATGLCRLEIEWFWGDYYKEGAFNHSLSIAQREGYNAGKTRSDLDNIAIGLWDGDGNPIHSLDRKEFCRGFADQECRWPIPGVEQPDKESGHPEFLKISPQHTHESQKPYLHISYGDLNFSTGDDVDDIRIKPEGKKPWCQIGRSWRNLEVLRRDTKNQQKVERAPRRGGGSRGGGGGVGFDDGSESSLVFIFNELFNKSSQEKFEEKQEMKEENGKRNGGEGLIADDNGKLIYMGDQWLVSAYPLLQNLSIGVV